MNAKWSENEKNYVRDNADSMKDEEIAKNLTVITQRKVTVPAVRRIRRMLGLKKKSGRGLCGIRKEKSDHLK